MESPVKCEVPNTWQFMNMTMREIRLLHIVYIASIEQVSRHPSRASRYRLRFIAKELCTEQLVHAGKSLASNSEAAVNAAAGYKPSGTALQYSARSTAFWACCEVSHDWLGCIQNKSSNVHHTPVI